MTVPDGLPVLSYGAHANPARGACVMEYVSILAGLPFNDNPECTDQMLANNARSLNDVLPDEFRHKLLPLIPKLIGSVDPDFDPADPRTRSGYRTSTWMRFAVLNQRYHRQIKIWGVLGVWIADPVGTQAPILVRDAVSASVIASIEAEIDQWVASFIAIVDDWNAHFGRTPEPLSPEQTRELAAAVG